MKLSIKELNKENCLTWHKNCQAECCKTMKLTLPEGNPRDWYRGNTITIPTKNLNQDMRRYLELHGARRTSDGNHVLKLGRVERKGHSLLVHNTCQALQKDFTCGIYPDRPMLCRKINDEDIRSNNLSGVFLTPNCLYKKKQEAIARGEQL